MAPVCHEHYYMKDGVTFLVENTLFRVPRYMLETTSPVFAAMLSDVRPDATPISLRDATSVEFERLLTFLYPLAPPVDTVAKPWDEHQWTSILRLATMWEMAEIRAVAMRLLGQIHDPFMKVTLGRQYGHQPWIKEGFMMLCLRPEPLTVEEGVQLTKEDVIACAAAREEIRLRVLPREHKRLTNRVHSSRRICAKESGPVANIMEYQQFFNNHIVRRIVNHAFGFENEEVEDDVSDAGSDKAPWWPLQEITTPNILWLIHPHDGEHHWSSNIKQVKDLPDSASIVTVADLEKHWIRGMLRKDFSKYFTPLSCSALALSVGFLILIPQAVASA